MRFEFATAGRIVFGAGVVRGVGALARPLGRHALIVTGRSNDRAEPVAALLRSDEVAATIFNVAGEPDTLAIEGGVSAVRAHGCDLVVAVGGGSAIDAAKAIAALATNGGAIEDYLEVIGRAQPLTRPSLPCIAIPTTAGTGSEVTRNSVIGSPRHQVKVSLRGAGLLPTIAVVDPELTRGLSREITARTGLDALTQVIEPLVSCRANPLTDAVASEGLRLAARALPVACRDGSDASARRDMSLASLCGGLSLANAGLGVVHGFAGPIGGMFPAPHGAVCAALLAHGVNGNIRALRSRAPDHPALRRYETVARLLTGRETASPDDAVTWLRNLVDELQIPALRTWGVSTDDVPALVEKAARASSMKANPIVLTSEELAEILVAAI